MIFNINKNHIKKIQLSGIAQEVWQITLRQFIPIWPPHKSTLEIYANVAKSGPNSLQKTL